MKHLIAMLVLLGCGCGNDDPPLSEWQVQLVAPTGEVADEWTVKCHGNPSPVCEWGGQTKLVDRHSGSYEDWERNIVAPVGWRLKVVPKER